MKYIITEEQYNFLLSEQKSVSQKISLPQEVSKIQNSLGKNGTFQKDRKTVNLKSNGKEMSVMIPTLRLSGPGTWMVNGSNIIFSQNQ